MHSAGQYFTTDKVIRYLTAKSSVIHYGIPQNKLGIFTQKWFLVGDIICKNNSEKWKKLIPTKQKNME